MRVQTASPRARIDSQAPQTQPSARRHSLLVRLLVVATFVVATLTGLDGLLQRCLWSSQVIHEPVDIQSPMTLYTKLKSLRAFEGYKVAVLGDSVVFGQSMQEHGDEEWRQHTLSALLEKRLRRTIEDPVLVLNLGMNGALPADVERITRLVVGCDVDLVVFDVSLRSFSEDFSKPGSVLSRPWLAEVAMDEEGRFCTVSGGSAWSSTIEANIADFLANRWSLYRMRDLLQQRYLGGQPRRVMTRLWNTCNRRLDADRSSTDGDVGDQLVLQMKARSRYGSVNMRPENKQRQALRRTLSLLSSRNQPTVVFYAKEKPRAIPRLMDSGRYRRLLRELGAIIENADGKRNGGLISFIPPIPELMDEHYLDHVHVDQVGHALYAGAIWQAIKGMEGDPSDPYRTLPVRLAGGKHEEY